MTRYYLAATAIVVLIGSLVFAHRLRPPDLHVVAQPTGTPTITVRGGGGDTVASAFTGQGPWVLSALPSCFDEQSRVRGPAAEMSPKLPPASERIPAGRTFTRGDCTVMVGSDDIRVTRGSDRVRVPPPAALYRDGDGDGLTLVTTSGGTVEIRRY
jgi:hypothetical protein